MFATAHKSLLEHYAGKTILVELPEKHSVQGQGEKHNASEQEQYSRITVIILRDPYPFFDKQGNSQRW